ncbi:sigma-54-dependent transcriptional regulator [Desulfoluna spongiiphila]|uniref:Two-component system, NtrC family, response regulator n=1 Tax=Desulfoluna spongiiphila TaxID=419481 RepID=A0A1G5HCH3_9BACT|nr:sigma-54 dependent transcriptional regulator [Desulfoluna spongiiphila]SCY61199.1 two-component system, NtrC family, response regulator [Desulfoluna spongiiphila]
MDVQEQALILVVDDDHLFFESMKSLITRMGHRTLGAGCLAEAHACLDKEAVDIVLLDLFLPDGLGVDHIERLRQSASNPELIMITGKGDPDSAGQAIKKGALDYLVKPSSVQATRSAITRALTHRKAIRDYRRPSLCLDAIIGQSAPIRRCFDMVARAAGCHSGVLITGETGTGKELFARTIHENSPRKVHQFITVDCAALTETLVESTLFGHSKGAFTSADQDRTGLVKAADKGTLFLDEIGEMPLALQKNFLRVLQEKRFRPVGSTTEVESDFRVIAATNRNLPRMVEEGRFRRDLLFRLRAFTLKLPPLHKRKGDLMPLAVHHARGLAARYGMAEKQFEPGFFDQLSRCVWPGNVRELFNVIEHAFFAAGECPILRIMDLPEEIRIELAQLAVTQGQATEAEGEPHDSLSHFFAQGEPSIKEAKSRLEQRYLEELIQYTQGDVQRMLDISGLSRSHLYAMFKRFELTQYLKK